MPCQVKPGFMIDMMAAGRPPKLKRTALGQQIVAAREAAGLTQTELGQKLGVSQRVIANWERKPVALRAEQLAALADALDVSADHLLGRPNGKPASQKGPIGKLRQAFEKAQQLPRSEQQYILKVVEAFVDAKNGSAK
jgi:transcriptional regulator with XRE-family HTH domain